MARYKLVKEFPGASIGDILADGIGGTHYWIASGKKLPKVLSDNLKGWVEKIKDSEFIVWSRFSSIISSGVSIITAIKKLDGGKVISRGDKFIFNGTQYTITDFQSTGNKFYVYSSATTAFDAEKCIFDRKFLFHSDDGVQVYEGDEWFYVVEGKTEIKKSSTLDYVGSNPKPVKRFISEARAGQYVINICKRIFSFKEVIELPELKDTTKVALRMAFDKRIN